MKRGKYIRLEKHKEYMRQVGQCWGAVNGKYKRTEFHKSIVGEMGKKYGAENLCLYNSSENNRENARKMGLTFGRINGPKNLKKYNKEKWSKDSSNNRKEFIKNNPEEFKKFCRRGGLSSFSKRAESMDGVFVNTIPEIEMKRCLNELGVNYVFQYPVKSIEHCYVADFYLPLYNIILEVDGRWAHNYPDGKEIDFIRTQELEEAGYRVLRLWEGQFNAQSVWREI